MKKGYCRGYISIYFSDGINDKRKKRDLTIALDKESKLYKKCKQLCSSEIREIIGTNSYIKLVKKAKAEDRSLGNYIKRRLKKEFGLD